MTLNLKTFQSYNQKPYCKAHLPKVTGTGLGADSAELKRLRNVSNMVSNVQYKQDYEKMKGDAGSFVPPPAAAAVSGVSMGGMKMGRSGSNHDFGTAAVPVPSVQPGNNHHNTGATTAYTATQQAQVQPVAQDVPQLNTVR